eukprot:TRINITY_DN8628_c0_g2_i1.p1 TRINITY_DN8628_c0_g2~~TRINITY_DN8628_c0_g2_i1.p1  ORF type:complete len:137 (-),score=25.29 TRINITY_DN8628_c0_g2_i1:116-526(-)
MTDPVRNAFASREAMLERFVGCGVAVGNKGGYGAQSSELLRGNGGGNRIAESGKRMFGDIERLAPVTNYATATVACLAAHSRLTNGNFGPDPPEEPKVRLARTVINHGPRNAGSGQRPWHADGPNPLLAASGSSAR